MSQVVQTGRGAPRVRVAWLVLSLALTTLGGLGAAEKVRVYPCGESDPDVEVGDPVVETLDVESGPTENADGQPVADGQGEFVPLVAAGGPVYVEGRDGEGSLAISFDGQNDKLTSPAFDPRHFSSFNCLSQAWVRPHVNKQGIEQSVWSLGNDNGGVGISSSGHWKLIASSGVPDTDSPVRAAFGEWTHVAVYRHGNGAELYVNGELILQGGAFWNGVGAVTLGHRSTPGFTPTFFQGDIDDFAISGLSDGSFDTAADIDGIDESLFSDVPGDVDQDGLVDERDYAIWSQNVGFDNELGAGDVGSLLKGDVDDNGRINYFDFQIIATLAGSAAPPPGPEDVEGLVVAEDFLYDQLTKELGPGGGFQRQDYGGGQNGLGGQWNGRWISVGNGIITGSDFDLNGTPTPCFAAGEEVPLIELAPGDQQHVGYTIPGLSANNLQRGFTFDERTLEESIYFAARVMVLEGSSAIGALTLGDGGDETAIRIGFDPAGGFSVTLGFATDFTLDTLFEPGRYHQLVARLEFDTILSAERLTLWVDPVAEEESDEEIFVESDVLEDPSGLLGRIVLGRGTSGCGPIFWDDVAVGTTWDSVVDREIQRPRLLIDEAAERVYLVNSADAPIDINYIQLTSVTGSLNTRGWTSLADQGIDDGAWQENRIHRWQLIESHLDGSTRLEAGARLDLGEAFIALRPRDLIARVGTRQGLLSLAPRLESAPDPVFLRGDSNSDCIVEMADALFTLTHLFLGGDEPACLDAADGDDSGVLDLADPIITLVYLFLGTERPPAPGPQEAGPDPGEDGLKPCVAPDCP